MQRPTSTCNFFLVLPFSVAGVLFNVLFAGAQVTVSGELKKWHRITLTIDGIITDEAAAVNPFTDYRLNVTFTNGSTTYTVPGFYAADGNASETSASAGDKWKVYFTPDETGEWNYTVSFRTGAYIAVTNDTGVSVPPDSASGSFFIQPSDKTRTDFRAKGMLRYIGAHHLQFAETGEYYLKGGADSPENFLAYFEFDQTSDMGGGNDATLVNGLHQYAPHVQHWQQGDPAWQNGKGKGIIGALNYLASQQVNSVYFLTYNIDNGDGRDTWMWTSPTERERFDCSKLDQWEIVFSHMDSLGIQLHLVTQEQENDQSLGDSLQQLNNIRKLYYRELVARFSHHLALQWNLGEENTNTDAERAAFAQFISEYDAYGHPIGVHTPNGGAPTYYDTILATPAYLQYFEAASLQGMADKYNSWAIQLRDKSNTAGRKWAIYGDEQIPIVAPDGSNFDALRRDALWGNLMGGGAGVEWYFGYQVAFGDLQSEDFTVVEALWQYTAHALQFFQNHLPFHEMVPANNLIINGSSNDCCLAKEGQVYAVYLENGGSANTRLSILQPGNYIVKWYNPRTGGALQDGSVPAFTVTTAGNFLIGQAPVAGTNDWVVLLQNDYVPMQVSIVKNDIPCFGQNSGTAEAMVTGGTLPYSYQWSNGAETKVISNLAPGEYIVTVTDGFSYSASDTVFITEPAALSMTSAVKMSGGSGEIALDVSGGTPPYSFAWNTGNTSQLIDSLTSGIYCVTVTDANGCSLMGCDTIAIPQCVQSPFVCNDGDACTVDTCDNGVCVSTPLNCDDGNVCTGDACDAAGQCVHTLIVCDDADACTVNDCDSADGCFYIPLLCPDDGDLCTLESCENGECISNPVVCNDQFACTEDACVNGGCSFDTIVCDDNIVCTTDACENDICVFTAADCDDNNLCTTDNCDTSGQCVYTDVTCDDGDLCTTNDCASETGCFYTLVICAGDGNPCTTETCLNGDCISNPVGCNDGNSCTSDICENGECVFQNLVCNDNNSCTSDNCESGECVFTDIACNDNIACTTDSCQNGDCYYTPIACNDNNLCTTDNCEDGQCVFTNLICNDNNPCTADNCQDGNCVSSPIVCADDGNPCTIESCAGGQCVSNPVACNDNNTCTSDACQNGQCVFTPVVCDDNNPCTNDACSNGQCLYTALPLQVGSLTLVNSSSDVDLRDLNDSDTINLAVTPNVNIRANACGSAKSVRFVLNGSTFRTESAEPFALAGDNSGNYNKWNVSVGLYTLVATPYSGSNASGTAGTAKTISIRVINQEAPACTSNAGCNDNNPCTNNICQSGQCVFTAVNCSDNDPCTNDLCNDGVCSNTSIVCNDNNLCTTDACVNGTCVYTPKNCNDGDACTADACNDGACVNSTLNCNDNNPCTSDNCNVNTGCTNVPIANCCNSDSGCDDDNPCTIDQCNNGTCQFTEGGNEPSYLRIINPSRSWRKLKLGYSPNSLWSPKVNATVGGNNTMCVTLRTVGTLEWNKIQIRPMGSSSGAAILGNYVTGSVENWTTVCIPLSEFTGINFSQLTFLEMPYSNGAMAFEIHLQKIVFNGGTTPFLWFGDPKTDNKHDGGSGSGSALIASLIQGNPCASKMESDQMPLDRTGGNFHLGSYPNPFSGKVNIDFRLEESSRVKLEMFNVSGQLLDVLFDGEVRSSTLYQFVYTPHSISEGVIIYRLQTQKDVYYGKAMMVR